MTAPEGNLHDWLMNLTPEAAAEYFPGKADYPRRYGAAVDYLNRHVHPEVEKGAILAQIRSGDCSEDTLIYLTNHGPEHVEHVITKASEIRDVSGFSISPYECYLLLVAIHLHDVGNLFGREGHGRNCGKVVKAMGGLLGTETPEIYTITRMAAAHGGNAAGDKDTIGTLAPTSHLMGKPVKEQSLAALLRFADELADDSTRASRFLLYENQLPERSRLYHAYSDSLHSVIVEEGTISLRFAMRKPVALATYPKSL